MLLPKSEPLCLPPSPCYSQSVSSDSEMRDISSQDGSRHEDAPANETPAQAKKRRSRQNLSHMSQEEKMSRRKMKNRMAAQSARDRKKAKMDDMEVRVARLSEERIKLQKENERLLKRGHQLNEENFQLKQRLNSMENRLTPPTLPPAVETVAITTTTSASNNTRNVDQVMVKEEPNQSAKTTFESAALINDSQQQRQGSQTRLARCLSAQAGPSIKVEKLEEEEKEKTQMTAAEEEEEEDEEAFPWMMPFVCWLLAIENLMRSSTGWKSALTSFLKENLTKMPVEMLEMILNCAQDQEDCTSKDLEDLLREIPPHLRSSLTNLTQSGT